MAWKDSEFRHVLRRSRLSVASFILTGMLLIPLGSSFIGLLNQGQVEETVHKFLVKGTLTFSDPELVDVQQIDIDWDKEQIRIIVRVTDPDLPSYKQVTLVQEEINKMLQSNYQLVVQRTAVDVVGPKKVISAPQQSNDAAVEPAPQKDQSETVDSPKSPATLETNDDLDEP